MSFPARTVFALCCVNLYSPAVHGIFSLHLPPYQFCGYADEDVLGYGLMMGQRIKYLCAARFLKGNFGLAGGGFSGGLPTYFRLPCPSMHSLHMLIYLSLPRPPAWGLSSNVQTTDEPLQNEFVAPCNSCFHRCERWCVCSGK